MKKIFLISISILVVVLALYGLFQWQENEKVQLQIKELFTSGINLNLQAARALEKASQENNLKAATIAMKGLYNEFKTIHKKKKEMTKKYPYLEERQKYVSRYKKEIRQFLESIKKLHLTIQRLPKRIKTNADFKRQWRLYSKIFLRF